MSNDSTEKVPFEEQVLAELHSIRVEVSEVKERLMVLETKVDSLEIKADSLENKVDSLEIKVDARLRETRPIWEMVLKDLNAIKESQERIEEEFGVLAHG